MMKLKILIDNNQSKSNPKLLSEHGLSIYLEGGTLKYLFDVGSSGRWLINACELGLNVEDIDHLILSHGHSDHTGGLSSFLVQNSKAKVFASEKISKYIYSSYRHETSVNLSPHKHVLDEYHSRFIYLNEDYQLSQNIRLVFSRKESYPLPEGNKFLFVEEEDGEKPYLADDELSLAITIGKSLVIISSCSHRGILNIIESCIQSTGISNIAAFIGGLHLVDIEEGQQDDVIMIADTIKHHYPDMALYTGHCTGKKAYRELKRVLGDSVHKIYSGMSLIIG
jgi:7,8-dihydropterin-6-yl-methyl-4-(beta-D-ribofuranosyl)aminobenzene 5'-phosphate synthase